MTPDEFRSYGHRLIDWIADYRTRLADRPVMARTAPGAIKNQLPPSPPERPDDFEGVFRDLERILLPGLSHWQPGSHGVRGVRRPRMTRGYASAAPRRLDRRGGEGMAPGAVRGASAVAVRPWRGASDGAVGTQAGVPGEG